MARCATEDSVSAGQAKMKTSNLILTALALNACLAGSARSQQVNETGFVATISNNTAAPKPAPEGMVWIPGGEFSMGSLANGGGSCEMPWYRTTPSRCTACGWRASGWIGPQ